MIAITSRVYAFQAMVTAVAIAFVIGATAGFGAAWRIYGWKEAATDLVVERAASAGRLTEETRQRDIGARHQTKRDLIEKTFEEIDDATEHLVAASYALRSIDLGPDVLCVWRAANEGRSAAAAGCRAPGEVPAAAAAGGREGVDAAQEPRADGEALPPGLRGPRIPDRSGNTAEGP
ncbi:MAG: hypothetical protein HYV17_07975 [Xanthomonadales bacterium]|nr:hypothetical protein [Xanthomonadales bacterium]